MRKKLHISARSGRVAVTLLACGLLAGCCPQNPKAWTVRSAHGNTDFNINTAEAFCTGKDMTGQLVASNHCPSTWSCKHVHVGLSNTNHFYFDKDVKTPGDDADPTNGIDQTMLFFESGHGERPFVGSFEFLDERFCYTLYRSMRSLSDSPKSLSRPAALSSWEAASIFCRMTPSMLSIAPATWSTPVICCSL